MFKRILLAVDGSSHSMHAAEIAADLARQGHADLRVVTAYDPVPLYIGEPNLQNAISARMEVAESILKATLEVIKEIPGELKTEVLEGSAAEAILEVANTRKNDLIVMGSRGLGTLSGLLLGSQSQKVVHHSPCPVLIVK
jgi:nucleotide-binding universal stress UspA family protein